MQRPGVPRRDGIFVWANTAVALATTVAVEAQQADVAGVVLAPEPNPQFDPGVPGTPRRPSITVYVVECEESWVGLAAARALAAVSFERLGLNPAEVPLLTRAHFSTIGRAELTAPLSLLWPIDGASTGNTIDHARATGSAPRIERGHRLRLAARQTGLHYATSRIVKLTV